MRLKHLALLAVLAALGGLLLAWSGLVSVAASSGHYAATAWFLHFTLRQAVATQSSRVEVPPGVLDDRGKLALGAAHYADGCAPCHGAPGEPRSAPMLAMMPPPPWLPPIIPTWDPEELFWIVQHGIKYSGMPAWATQSRPDEVWAVVAFLQALPEMDGPTYRKLALGPATPPSPAPAPSAIGADGLEPVLAGCARCHGRDGAGRAEGGVPLIGGQSEAYLAATLRAYADGRRASGIMQPQAGTLPPEMLQELTRHYAAQPWGPARGGKTVDAARLARGAEVARRGVPGAGVPPCASCHEASPLYPNYPRIAGQDAGFVARQLQLFRDGTRGGTAFGHVMPVFARGLTDADIDAVAEYYSQAEPALAVK